MSDPLVIQPPVRGEWAIMNPPGHAPLAYDFLAVQDSKCPYKGATLLKHILSTIHVEHTHAWGKPVYATGDGTVVAAHDGVSDRLEISMAKDLIRLLLFGPKQVPPFPNLGGNHVILKCGDVYPLYAHLQRGSVLVRPGDAVHAGDPLGLVGNSGSSVQPHLHFQVMNAPDPFPLFRNLLPFVFGKVSSRRGGSWQTVASHAPRNGDHLLL